jgi:hypothetical protein
MALPPPTGHYNGYRQAGDASQEASSRSPRSRVMWRYARISWPASCWPPCRLDVGELGATGPSPRQAHGGETHGRPSQYRRVRTSPTASWPPPSAGGRATHAARVANGLSAPRGPGCSTDHQLRHGAQVAGVDLQSARQLLNGGLFHRCEVSTPPPRNRRGVAVTPTSGNNDRPNSTRDTRIPSEQRRNEQPRPPTSRRPVSVNASSEATTTISA